MKQSSHGLDCTLRIIVLLVSASLTALVPSACISSSEDVGGKQASGNAIVPYEGPGRAEFWQDWPNLTEEERVAKIGVASEFLSRTPEAQEVYGELEKYREAERARYNNRLPADLSETERSQRLAAFDALSSEHINQLPSSRQTRVQSLLSRKKSLGRQFDNFIIDAYFGGAHELGPDIVKSRIEDFKGWVHKVSRNDEELAESLVVLAGQRHPTYTLRIREAFYGSRLRRESSQEAQRRTYIEKQKRESRRVVSSGVSACIGRSKSLFTWAWRNSMQLSSFLISAAILLNAPSVIKRVSNSVASVFKFFDEKVFNREDHTATIVSMCPALQDISATNPSAKNGRVTASERLLELSPAWKAKQVEDALSTAVDADSPIRSTFRRIFSSDRVCSIASAAQEGDGRRLNIEYNAVKSDLNQVLCAALLPGSSVGEADSKTQQGARREDIKAIIGEVSSYIQNKEQCTETDGLDASQLRAECAVGAVLGAQLRVYDAVFRSHFADEQGADTRPEELRTAAALFECNQLPDELNAPSSYSADPEAPLSSIFGHINTVVNLPSRADVSIPE